MVLTRYRFCFRVLVWRRPHRGWGFRGWIEKGVIWNPLRDHPKGAFARCPYRRLCAQCIGNCFTCQVGRGIWWLREYFITKHCNILFVSNPISGPTLQSTPLLTHLEQAGLSTIISSVWIQASTFGTFSFRFSVFFSFFRGGEQVTCIVHSRWMTWQSSLICLSSPGIRRITKQFGRSEDIY